MPTALLIGVTSGPWHWSSRRYRSYDFFLYYFTLIITPMFLVSGVFFPAEKYAQAVQWAAQWLPLPMRSN
jgi:lipooligosaccharide transport system permease protein